MPVIESALVGIILQQLEAGATSIDWARVQTQAKAFVDAHLPKVIAPAADFLVLRLLRVLPVTLNNTVLLQSVATDLLTGNPAAAWKAVEDVVVKYAAHP